MYRKISIFRHKNFSSWFMATGILIQILTFLIMKDPILSCISGIAGVISVVQCSERKISFYFWGFLQIGTFVAICLQENLYAKLIENAFYVVTMLFGIWVWLRNKDTDDNKKVKSKSLSEDAKSNIFMAVIVSVCCFSCILSSTDDPLPIMDSLTTVPAIAAQALMVTRHKEQWIYWGFVDIVNIALWAIAGNWCMVAQYIFWTINCLYGAYNWKILNNNGQGIKSENI